MKRGRVILVGAGPGRAGSDHAARRRGAAPARTRSSTTRWRSKALLDLAPPDALRIDVGKRGHDAPTRTAGGDDGAAAAARRRGPHRRAAQGRRSLRVRPRRRGGQRLRARPGIPFEVVPGVSSIFGALAYAGIPITDRRHGASFAVVTGHKDPTKVTRETRWDLLAHAADTLVVLMGMRNLEEIVGAPARGGPRARDAGGGGDVGTLPAQRVVDGAARRARRARARGAGVGAPAVVVVGDVVSLRDALAWYERQPLFGRRVLVTRAPSRPASWRRRSPQAGARGRCSRRWSGSLPPDDPAPLDAALDRLADYDAIVFTSANAVRFTARRARAARHRARARARARVVLRRARHRAGGARRGLRGAPRAAARATTPEAVLEQLLARRRRARPALPRAALRPRARRAARRPARAPARRSTR